MNTSDIRTTFLEFFEEKGHVVLPGSSLVPVGDPSVLLTTAGMQQFKAYFTSERPAPFPRAATVQKTFRTTDFDDVGDLSHLTFFEMLGNFSFGDYFKQEAIEFGRELVIERLGVEPDRLWATVYRGSEGVPRDDESFQIWADLGHPTDRIAYAGEDNFWGPTGDSGPCGPTTEFHFNLRPDEPDVGPIEAPDRYLEFWNLVFNQYAKSTDGELTPLAKNGVDTGAGLERWAVMLQGAPSIYDTDLWRPLVDAVASLAGVKYEPSAPTARSIRIVAQHVRASVFLIADGVMPGNEGRGYVLRRGLRQAVRHARVLGVEDDALLPVARATIDAMCDAYPDLERRHDFILSAVGEEESRFRRTLDSGLTLLEAMLTDLPEGEPLAGDKAFLLYDTYGFPPDITKEVVEDRGRAFDELGFDAALGEQRERSRAAVTTDAERDLPSGFGETAFQGYDFTSEGRGTIVAMSVGGDLVESAAAGAEVQVVLDRTPFYGEAGGQVGDTGSLDAGGSEARVHDTLRTAEGTFVHAAEVVRGTLAVGDIVEAHVDRPRRLDIMRNHSATHLLHAALRQILGEHVRQAGSLVAPDRLRFDFTHTGPLTLAERRAVEDWVNARVLEGLEIDTQATEVREAVEQGAMALFGEKYGEVVRMVSMGGASRELCGGTHCENTGRIGLIAITSESGVAAGVRRIEAVTGAGALAYVRSRQDLLMAVASELEVPPADAPERVRRLRQEAAELRRTLAAADRVEAMRGAERLLAGRERIDGLHVIVGSASVANRDALRELTNALTARLDEPWVMVVASVIEGKPSFVTAASPRAVESGVHAGELARTVAEVTGGGGGGRPELAMAGGRDAEKITRALDAGRTYLRGVEAAW